MKYKEIDFFKERIINYDGFCLKRPITKPNDFRVAITPVNIGSNFHIKVNVAKMEARSVDKSKENLYFPKLKKDVTLKQTKIN